MREDGTTRLNNKMTTEKITIMQDGPRLYIVGDTFPIKDAIKEAGGHWDKELKQWWIGTKKRAEIEAAIAKASASGAMTADHYTPTTGEAFVRVEGNTYPVKDRLRAMGGRWNGDAKVWEVPASQAERARGAVAAAGPKKPYSGPRRSSGFSRGDGGPRGSRSCYMCGSYYCEGARGGLCEDD